MLSLQISVIITIIFTFSHLLKSAKTLKSCSDLLMGQYWCEEPIISPHTQLPETCQRDNSVTVICEVASEIDCLGLDNKTRRFLKRIPNGCSYSTGIDYSTTLLLSVFFGWLGFDRFYLGYYAIGLLKMFSFGCFTLLYLVDIVLIALQLLGPADGSAYRIHYYGPKVTPVRFSNDTYVALYTCFNCPKSKEMSQAQLQVIADLEMEMMSDLYRRMTAACQQKCISTRYNEAELTKGEAVCLDRCVAKYLDVHEKLGKRLTTMSQQDEKQLQQMQLQIQQQLQQQMK